MQNTMCELQTSCESEESKNYYLLNQEALLYKYELANLKKKRLSIRNLKILGSYLKNGAYSRIKDGLKSQHRRNEKHTIIIS